ncbi:MAG: hypothetical protein WAM88_03090, partial [Nitrososphaeraceae archaeon]
KLSEINSLVNRTGIYSIHSGNSGWDNEQFEIYGEDLDGKLNIVPGKKNRENPIYRNYLSKLSLNMEHL